MPIELQSFPIDRLAVLQRPGHLLLLCGSFSAPSHLRRAVVDRLLRHGPATVTLSFERMDPWVLHFDSHATLHASLAGDARPGEYRLSSDHYFKLSNGRALGYSSLRDTFGVLSIDRSCLSPADIERWDQLFIRHVRRTGVGFGEAGRRYLHGLLAEWDDPRGQSLSAMLGLA